MKLYDKQVLVFGSQLGTHGTTQYVRCLWGFDDLPKHGKNLLNTIRTFYVTILGALLLQYEKEFFW